MNNYEKPKVIAKNLSSGSYAAGCPPKDNRETGDCLLAFGHRPMCKECERSA